MELLKAKRKQAIEQYRRNENDSGSAEVQIAILTTRIVHLTEHMKIHRKDFSTQRGLMKMVGNRSALLKYLRNTDVERYHKLILDLGLRK